MQDSKNTGTENATKANSTTDVNAQPTAANANKQKAASSAKKASADIKAKKAYIYCGPNLPGGILFNGNLFKGEIPKHLKETFKKVPELKKLFVEVQSLPSFKSKVENQGSEEYALYQFVEREIRKGALKNV